MSHPSFIEWLLSRKKEIVENKSKNPDYSFDNWVRKVKNLDDEIESLSDQAKDAEKKIDTESKMKGKEKESVEPDGDDDGDDHQEKKKKEEVWNKLKDLHSERQKKLGKSSSDKSKASALSGAKRLSP